MIKQNQKVVNNLIVIADIITIICAFLLAYHFRINSGIMKNEGGYLSFKQYIFPLIYMIPIYIVIYNSRRLYSTERVIFISNEVWNILVSNVLSVLIFLGILFITKQVHYSRVFLIFFFVLSSNSISNQPFLIIG